MSYVIVDARGAVYARTDTYNLEKAEMSMHGTTGLTLEMCACTDVVYDAGYSCLTRDYTCTRCGDTGTQDLS